MLLNKDDIIEKLNEALPPPIRAVAYKRTTKGFNSKNQCSGRTYAYLTPTYAFAPVEKFVTEEYRTTPEIITSVNKILASYIGTHNFHNFTSGVKPEDAKAKRYIISFQCGEPFVEDGIEFAIIRVKGQSFMMHHIRKMVGLMVAIVKGYCSEESLQTAWKPEKMDVPKAPGTGLMLEQLHYDGYNKRFGNDGMHEPIDWSEYQEQIDKFKREYIISEMIKAEKEEKVMMKWLGTLQYHKFDMMDQEDNPWWKMRAVVSPKKRASESEDSPVSEPAQDAPALSSDSVKTKDEPQEKEECNKGDNSEVYMTVETQDSDAKESSAEKDVPLETDSIPETSNSDDVQQDKERLKESAA